MVGGKRDVVGVAVVGGLIDGEEIRRGLRGCGKATMSGQTIGLMSSSMLSFFRLSSMTSAQRRCCSRPVTWTIVSFMPPFGVLRLGQKLLGLGEIGARHGETGIVAENAVRQRSDHQLRVACQLQHRLIVEGVRNGAGAC